MVITMAKKEPQIKGQPAYLEVLKKTPDAKKVVIEGYKYVYADAETLIPNRGAIAHKSDIGSVEKSPNSAWVSAVKLLNGVK